MDSSRRIALTLAYDGSDYSGWQRQVNAKNVQETFENTLARILKQETRIYASGRTDAGVHALGQVIHFDTKLQMPASAFIPALNSLLPDDIRVQEAREVDGDFNARYSAKRKTYVYRIRSAKLENPLTTRYEWTVSKEVDIGRMKEAAALFVGQHDFSAFCSTGSKIVNNVRNIFSSELNFSGDEIEYRITGKGFLYNMVRIIVGTIVEIGTSKIPLESIQEAFDKKDRRIAGTTAPAKGLVLYQVEY